MPKAGAPAVNATPEVWQSIEKAAVGAVAAGPAAREHVLGKLLKRAGGPSAKSGRAPG